MLPILHWVELTALALVTQVNGQWTYNPFAPPAVPLAVRTPYLSVWSSQSAGASPLSNVNPLSISSSAEWYAAVKVDGQTCRIMGVGGDGISEANQTAVEFTPTRTSFLFQCFSVAVNATFLTPIIPRDLVRQSMPFSYFYMQATATDEANHNISMYSDAGVDLFTSSTTQAISGSFVDVGNDHIILYVTHNLQPFAESAVGGSFGLPLDATVFYGIKTDIFPAGYSWEISLDSTTRANFAKTTALSNSTSFDNLTSTDGSVLAIAVDHGKTVSTPDTIWAIGLIRDPVVQFALPDGSLEKRHSYYLSTSSTTNGSEAMQFFLDDFGAGALSGSVEMDLQLQNDAGKISPEYADLISLVTRQALSAMDITIGQNSDGSWDTSDVKAFMDNTGNAGSTPGVNVVDIIYASLPAYLYFNADIAAYLISPLLEYQDSAQYQLPYAARNIGSAYPNATADSINEPHELGVEETANMLIITLAHAQRTGNGTLISAHYSLLRRWADYLIDNALFPTEQSSPDFSPVLNTTDALKNNLTNIALKGIIGIGAMGKISSYAGVKNDASNLTNIAQQYIQQWAGLTISSNKSHLLMTYGDDDSEVLLYNLYADKLLQLNLVPEEVYDIHTAYINSNFPSRLLGIPLDGNDLLLGTINDTEVFALLSRTDWMMFSAAVVTNDTTRDNMIQMVRNFAASNISSPPFCIEYEVQSGLCVGGSTSPAQAGLFAFLGMNQPISTVISVPSGGTVPVSHKKVQVGSLIAGGVVGGLAGLAVLAVGQRYYRRYTRRLRRQQPQRQRDYYNLEGLKPGRTPGLVQERPPSDNKS